MLFLTQKSLTSIVPHLTLLIIVGCQSGNPPEPIVDHIRPSPIFAKATATATPINPSSLLKLSGEVMEGLETFHFRLDHRKGGLEFLPGLIINDIEGDVVKPDKISVSFNGLLGSGLAIKSSLIAFEDQVYMTNPLTGQWTAGPEAVNALGFFNPNQGVQMMMSQISQLTLVNSGPYANGSFTISGRLATHTLTPLVGSTLEDSVVKVELTIDSRLFYLLEAKFIGAVTPNDSDLTIRVITLSKFDEPVSIEQPIAQRPGP